MKYLLLLSKRCSCMCGCFVCATHAHIFCLRKKPHTCNSGS